jgi:hypothetical protein
MAHYLPNFDEVYQYFPRSVGGLDQPYPGNPDWDVLEELLDPIHRAAIHQILQKTADPWVERALSRFASNDRARGIDLSNRFVEDEILGSLQLSRRTVYQFYGGEGDGGYPDERDTVTDAQIQIVSGISADDWNFVRISDRKRIAQRNGFISLDDAWKQVEKPYIFKKLLLEGADAIGRYDLTPWKKRYASLIDDLKKLGITEEMDPIRIGFRKWKLYDAVAHKKVTYIPMTRLPLSLATLKVPYYRWDDNEGS